MKCGVSYSLFEGLELLEYSLKSIREEIDYINVVFQDKSFYGQSGKKGRVDILNDLKKKKLIDHIILHNNFKYATKPSEAKTIERHKRNIGLQNVTKNKCNYFMTMDVDEFYATKSLKMAKEYILKNNVGVSFCKIANYTYLPIYRHKNLEQGGHFFVNFLSQVNHGSCAGSRRKYASKRCDPTRHVCGNVNNQLHVFSENQIVMHHMQNVRLDIKEKIDTSSKANGFHNKQERSQNLLQKFKSIEKDGPEKHNLIVVDNIFDIPVDQFKISLS